MALKHARDTLVTRILQSYHPTHTSHAPLDLHGITSHGHNIMEWLHAQRDPCSMSTTQFERHVQRVNRACHAEQMPAFHAFLMGMHRRIGALSPVYTCFRTHRYYDVHVLPHIWSFLYIPLCTPAFVAPREPSIQRSAHDRERKQFT